MKFKNAITIAALTTLGMFAENKVFAQAQNNNAIDNTQAQKADSSYHIKKAGAASSIMIDTDDGEVTSSFMETWDRDPNPRRANGGIASFNSSYKNPKEITNFAMKIEKNGHVTVSGAKLANKPENQYIYKPIGEGTLDEATLKTVIDAYDRAMANSTVSPTTLNQLKNMQAKITDPLDPHKGGQGYNAAKLQDIQNAANGVKTDVTLQMQSNFENTSQSSTPTLKLASNSPGG